MPWAHLQLEALDAGVEVGLGVVEILAPPHHRVELAVRLVAEHHAHVVGAERSFHVQRAAVVHWAVACAACRTGRNARVSGDRLRRYDTGRYGMGREDTIGRRRYDTMRDEAIRDEDTIWNDTGRYDAMREDTIPDETKRILE